MIENKIANSGLITLDLEKLIPQNIVFFDIKEYLFRGLIVKEKDFREALKHIEWSQYQDKYAGILCSSDAIIPMWAYMLITMYLQPFALSVHVGDENTVKEQLLLKAIELLNTDDYKNEKIIIKGCSDITLSGAAFAAITQKLLPVVKSLMYGEACSTVPVYKRKDL